MSVKDFNRQTINNYFLGKKFIIKDVRNEFCNFFTLNGYIRHYVKGEIIFHLNDNPREAYLVKDGRVKIYTIKPNGKEVIFSIVNPGEVFGLAEVLLNSPRIRFAKTLCKVTLWSISKEQLCEFYSNTDYCFKTLWLLTQHLLKYQNIIEELAVLPVRDRVIRLLVRLCKELGKQKGKYTIIDLPITHEEIAQMVGSTRQTVTIILNEMRKKGIIDWERKRIKILRWTDLIDNI